VAETLNERIEIPDESSELREDLEMDAVVCIGVFSPSPRITRFGCRRLATPKEAPLDALYSIVNTTNSTANNGHDERDCYFRFTFHQPAPLILTALVLDMLRRADR
jgi:hypothetical protein